MYKALANVRVCLPLFKTRVFFRKKLVSSIKLLFYRVGQQPSTATAAYKLYQVSVCSSINFMENYKS